MGVVGAALSVVACRGVGSSSVPAERGVVAQRAPVVPELPTLSDWPPSAPAGAGVHLPPEPSPPADDCGPPEPITVLFIGNSYTIMHDLPGLVEELGRQAGIPVHTEMLAQGGKNFEYHVAREQTAVTLEEGDWDIVVLQSHSLDAITNYEGFLRAGQALAQMVKRAGAQPILFETWPRKAGHSLYAYEAFGDNPDEMQEVVHERYHELADLTGAAVVDVGEAWRNVRKTEPELDPYASDYAHPAKIGAYLTANLFFAAITDVSPVGNVEPLLGIEEDAAAVLQAQAAAVVHPSCREL